MSHTHLHGLLTPSTAKRRWLGIALLFMIRFLTPFDSLALTVTPTAVTFQAVQGEANPPNRSVSISTPNGKQSNWTASTSAKWLTVTPAVGTITKTAQFAIAVNTSGLAAGTYSGTVAISLYKGGNTSILVTLTVAPLTAATSTTKIPATASLMWDPPATTNVAGYKVYVGTAPGVYGSAVNVGAVTSYAINNLGVGTYFFAVTAYDSSGVESSPSNEVSKSIY